MFYSMLYSMYFITEFLDFNTQKKCNMSKKQTELPLNDRDVLVVVEKGKVELYYGGRPFSAAIYYKDEDRLELPSSVPSFRSLKKIVKDTKDS